MASCSTVPQRACHTVPVAMEKQSTTWPRVVWGKPQFTSSDENTRINELPPKQQHWGPQGITRNFRTDQFWAQELNLWHFHFFHFHFFSFFPTCLSPVFWEPQVKAREESHEDFLLWSTWQGGCGAPQMKPCRLGGWNGVDTTDFCHYFWF